MRQNWQVRGRAKDWNHWFYLHVDDAAPPLKSEVAEELGLTSGEFSKRLKPRRYQPAISDAEAEITAQLWNQTVDYVRRIFPRRAEDAA